MVTAVGALEIAGRAARPSYCRPPPPPNRRRRRRHLFPCPSSQTAACRPRPLLKLTSDTKRRAENASPESCPILHASEHPIPERDAHALSARAVSPQPDRQDPSGARAICLASRRALRCCKIRQLFWGQPGTARGPARQRQARDPATAPTDQIPHLSLPLGPKAPPPRPSRCEGALPLSPPNSAHTVRHREACTPFMHTVSHGL